MTAAARAAQRHLLSMWTDIPIGTRVLVRNWAHSTETMSGPYVNANGVACIRLVGWNGIEIALDRVSLAGPRAVTVADTIQPAPADGHYAFADRPTTVIVTAILFFLTLGVCIAARLIAEGPMPPAWLCEETGLGCDWREAAP